MIIDKLTRKGVNLVGAADYLLVANLPADVLAQSGKLPGVRIINRFGSNLDVNAGTVPEDVWNGGGLYTGFPATAQPISLSSSSASDTAAGTGARTIQLFGLDANYVEITETLTLTGTVAVITANSYLRINRALVRTAGSGGSNVGVITARQQTSLAVFFAMPAGVNFTQLGVYTVPAGYTAYLDNFGCAINGSATGWVSGAIYARELGRVFLGRRQFFATNGVPYQDSILGGLPHFEKTDVVIRITGANGTGLDVVCHFDFYLVAN